MTQHANTVTLIGQVLQTWEVANDRHVRLSVRRPAYYPYRTDGPNDLVTVVLPEAVTRNQVIKNGDELLVQGFVRNEDVQVTLASLVRGKDAPVLPPELAGHKVKTIITTVVAAQWQLSQK